MNWAQKHAAQFGNRSADWVETYKVWHQLWIAEGYTHEEMLGAVTAVARRRTHPQWVTQHFSAMAEELRDERIRQMKRLLSQKEDTRGVCCTCRDTGQIVVPHRISMVNGQWTRNIPPHHGYTMAVICDKCRIGVHRKFRGQRLTEYETQFPDWRDEMKKWSQICLLRGDVDAIHELSLRGSINSVERRLGVMLYAT